MMPGRRKRKISNPSVERQIDPVSRQKVKDLFEKKFVYSKPKENVWELPLDFEKFYDYWEISELMKLKSTLNSLKDKLSDKDIVKWHEHTTFMNLAGNINTELRQTIRPELCTQAWCKFYEIVSTYDIFDVKSDTLNSVHLCEAPGAFVTSLNHYLYSGYKGEWSWLGSTLNPYYEGNSPSEMIDDDRFVRGSYGNWEFGIDDDGDLMSWPNLQRMLKRTEGMGPIHLVTADGSIDCQSNPAEQETVVSKLHYCEVLAAILILSPGGNLVLKKFTMFECYSVCLLYLINCLFTEVTIFKPGTSKSGNSEVYLICLGFMGVSERREQIEKLYHRYMNTTDINNVTCVFSRENIPADFIDQHIQCCHYFTSLQQETIENNLIFYNNMSEEFMEHIKVMKNYCTEIFFKKYEVQSIPGYMKITIPQKQHRELRCRTQKETKRNEGTYNDRVKVQRLPWEQKVLQYNTYDIDHNLVEWFENLQPPTEDAVRDWSCIIGRPVTEIKSSRFCHGKLIEVMQEIKKNWKEDRSDKDKLLPGSYTSPILSSLDVLYDQSASDFPCHVTIMSSAKFHDEEIKQKDYIENVSYITDIEDHCNEDSILVIMDLLQTVSETDIDCQQTLLKYLIKILKVMRKGNTVLIQMTTCLTRFTAGVVYILSSCFEKIGFLPQPGHKNQLQILICYKYTGVSNFLLEHCCYLVDKNCSKDDNSNRVLLETVPILSLLADVEFTYFLTKSNETLLKSYITDIVHKMKRNLPDQT